MKRFIISVRSAALGAMLLSGCGSPHGKPRQRSETLAPDQIMDFATLYSENCAGCHGADGKGGAAIALANPVFLAIADDATIRKVTANGVRGTAMPAFAQSAGGMLTDAQIDVITQGIRSRWSKPGILDGGIRPPTLPKSAGDAARRKPPTRPTANPATARAAAADQKEAPSPTDSFLALVSDQSLRTIVIAGRPEIGMPDWRGNVPGKPMSDQEITDVVAWLASKRVQNPGQPYPASNYSQHQESDRAERK